MICNNRIFIVEFFSSFIIFHLLYTFYWHFLSFPVSRIPLSFPLPLTIILPIIHSSLICTGNLIISVFFVLIFFINFYFKFHNEHTINELIWNKNFSFYLIFSQLSTKTYKFVFRFSFLSLVLYFRIFPYLFFFCFQQFSSLSYLNSNTLPTQKPIKFHLYCSKFDSNTFFLSQQDCCNLIFYISFTLT